jgi:hypothetical protein
MMSFSRPSVHLFLTCSDYYSMYYGLSRITANSTDLVLEYIVSEGGHSKVKDQFKITPWT